MHRLHKIARLGPSERSLLIEAAFLLLGYTLIVRLLPFRAWRRLALAEPRAGRGKRRLPPEKIRWAVAAAGRAVPGANCLPRALAARTLLRRAGHPARLRIGVIRSPEFSAHAWVELEGRAPARGLPGYAAFPRIGSAGR